MSKKGSHEERQVVKICQEHGYASIRVPASGARTRDDKPDVIAGNGKYYFAIEVKSSKKDYIYIRHEQIEELIRFSNKFGAVPLVCAKFTREPYSVFPIRSLEMTPSGKYKIHRKDVEKHISLQEYLKLKE